MPGVEFRDCGFFAVEPLAPQHLAEASELCAVAFESNAAYAALFPPPLPLRKCLAWFFAARLTMYAAAGARVCCATDRATGRVIGVAAALPAQCSPSLWLKLRSGLLLWPLRFGWHSFRAALYLDSTTSASKAIEIQPGAADSLHALFARGGSGRGGEAGAVAQASVAEGDEEGAGDGDGADADSAAEATAPPRAQQNFDRQNDWELANVAVDEAYRRRGVSSAMLAAVLEGVTAGVYLTTQNYPAECMYRKLGFCITNRMLVGGEDPVPEPFVSTVLRRPPRAD